MRSFGCVPEVQDCEDIVNQNDNASELWPSIMTTTIKKQGMDHSDEVKL